MRSFVMPAIRATFLESEGQRIGAKCRTHEETGKEKNIKTWF
jgi:hypothetical protein